MVPLLNRYQYHAIYTTLRGILIACMGICCDYIYGTVFFSLSEVGVITNAKYIFSD